MNTKHSFSHDLFHLSQDFNRLWEMIQNGHRVPAWIVYSDEYEDPIWDLIEVKTTPTGEYMIGSRGICYKHKKGKQGFLFSCMSLSLHYIDNSIFK